MRLLNTRKWFSWLPAQIHHFDIQFKSFRSPMRWISHFPSWGSKLSSPIVFLLFHKFVIFFVVKLSSAHFCRSEANNLQILLFQSSTFCCLALEEGSQYPKVHVMQRNSFHSLFHHLSGRHCPAHQTSIRPPFFPATSLPSSSHCFLCI